MLDFMDTCLNNVLEIFVESVSFKYLSKNIPCCCNFDENEILTSGNNTKYTASICNSCKLVLSLTFQTNLVSLEY